MICKKCNEKEESAVFLVAGESKEMSTRKAEIKDSHLCDPCWGGIFEGGWRATLPGKDSRWRGKED